MADASKRDQSFGTRKRKNYTSGNSLNEEPQDLSSLTESTIIIVVSFLEARGLVMLERINRRFGSKQAHEDQHVSLVAHAARCIFFDNATVNERNALPRYTVMNPTF